MGPAKFASAGVTAAGALLAFFLALFLAPSRGAEPTGTTSRKASS
jgi:hypothetical protein